MFVAFQRPTTFSNGMRLSVAEMGGVVTVFLTPPLPMESLSEDPAESKVAGRALGVVDRAFDELEGGKR
jgi:hypothetical protein